jgi:transcriptional regulator with XRE-family HTH domain
MHFTTILSNGARYPHPFWPRHPACARKQGIHQEEAAERCELHRTYYSGVERGVRNLSLVNVEKIAKGLRISLRNLLASSEWI